METREPSTHLNRGKKPDDKLERILEPWGLYRQKGVDGLSSKRKSPLEGFNCLETELTDHIDKKRKATIRENLIEIGYGKKNLNYWVEFFYKIWKYGIYELKFPKETLSAKPSNPLYNGDKRYSKINIILSSINSHYYNILIQKYENLWEIRDFQINWGWSGSVARNKLKRARAAAKKALRENGYKV